MRLRRGLVVGAALALAVPGAGDAAAAQAAPVEVRRLTIDVDPGIGGRFGGRVDVAVRFRVVNTGNGSVRPTARIQVESQIGGGTSSTPITLPAIAAGEQVGVARTIRSVLPFGSVQVVVTVRADGRASTATASAAVVPWLLLVAVLVLLGIVIGVRRVLRRGAAQ
jgi:hypothetical protein